jgi:hypothetical protein
MQRSGFRAPAAPSDLRQNLAAKMMKNDEGHTQPLGLPIAKNC